VTSGERKAIESRKRPGIEAFSPMSRREGLNPLSGGLGLEHLKERDL